MSLERRTFLKYSLAAGMAAPAILRTTRVRGAEFSLKWANNTPVTHPISLRAQEAAANIAKETGGKVDIQIFSNSQLGSDTDSLSQLRSGALEIFSISPLILAIFVPSAAINGVGFAWTGYDKVWPAMDGDLGAHVRGEIGKAGLHAFDRIWDNGFRQITSSTRVIATPEDIKGFKIRVPPSPLWTSMFKAFDASPITINISEAYTALQTRVAEGQENPLALIFSAKFYEVQKYLAKTNHMWDGYWQIANGRIWNDLPADVQTVIAKHINASALGQREDIFKLNGSLEKELTQKGMIFNSVDNAAFRAKLSSAGFYKEWKGKFGEAAWALLEKHTGSIS
jgi:tripartite ATP-independent transporter DctP family solute receptor